MCYMKKPLLKELIKKPIEGCSDQKGYNMITKAEATEFSFCVVIMTTALKDLEGIFILYELGSEAYAVKRLTLSS